MPTYTEVERVIRADAPLMAMTYLIPAIGVQHKAVEDRIATKAFARWRTSLRRTSRTHARAASPSSESRSGCTTTTNGTEAKRPVGENPMPYTQEELNSIWQKLMNDPERDEYGELDVSEKVESFGLLKARVLTNTDTEQAIAFGRSLDDVTEFDSLGDDIADADEITGTYARLLDNKEGPWGEWKKR